MKHLLVADQFMVQGSYVVDLRAVALVFSLLSLRKTLHSASLITQQQKATNRSTGLRSGWDYVRKQGALCRPVLRLHTVVVVL